MTADERSVRARRGAGPDWRTARRQLPERHARGGIALSAALHVDLSALVLFGLPNLFRTPAARRSMPIAVQLVTIAPETRATQPNPFRPRPTPSPSRRIAAAGAETRAEAGTAAEPAPPPAAAAAPAPPPPPKPEAKPVPRAAARGESRAETAAGSAAAAEAGRSTRAAAPPPVPEHKPRPKSERGRAAGARRGEARSQAKARAQARDEADRSSGVQQAAPDLEAPEKPKKKRSARRLRRLLKNLTRGRRRGPRTPTPAPQRMAAAVAALVPAEGAARSQLTASEIDMVRQQLSRCWNVPAGARDAKDLVVEIRGSIGPDGSVLQATIVDQGQARATRFSAPRRKAPAAPFSTPMHAAASAAGEIRDVEDLDVEFSPKDIL